MKKIIVISFILLSGNLYSQFTDFQSPFYGSLNSGDFASQPFGVMYSYQAWLCGDSGMVMKIYFNTIPSTFRIVKGNLPANLSLKALGSIDTNTAIVAGVSGSTAIVYRTSNAGQNWVQVFTQSGGNINGIWFKTAQNGIMIGNPVGGRWSVFRTTNAGVNWDSTGLYLPQAGSESGFANDIFARGDTVWMGTNNYRIYVSTNYGSGWSIRNIPGVQNIRCVNNDFASMGSNLGFIGGDSLLNSYDWGGSWSVVHNIPGTGPITGITASNPGVDASGFPLFYSKQNALYYNIQGWVLFHTASSGVYTYLFKARPIGQYWNNFSAMLGLMNDGKVWVCNCAWGGITPVNSELPSGFVLHQNYPNPFNPVTKIRFEIPNSKYAGAITLRVYNSSGELISELLRGTPAPGVYEVEFDGTNFASGVYFYMLENDNFSVSRKMLIVK